MQYPYTPNNNNNLDNSRNKLMSNNVEAQSRDVKESSGDFNTKPGRPHDIGKSDDNITNSTFGISNNQGTKQQQSTLDICIIKNSLIFKFICFSRLKVTFIFFL